jgi:hypothetical protein
MIHTSGNKQCSMSLWGKTTKYQWNLENIISTPGIHQKCIKLSVRIWVTENRSQGNMWPYRQQQGIKRTCIQSSNHRWVCNGKFQWYLIINVRMVSGYGGICLNDGLVCLLAYFGRTLCGTATDVACPASRPSPNVPNIWTGVGAKL